MERPSRRAACGDWFQITLSSLCKGPFLYYVIRGGGGSEKKIFLYYSSMTYDFLKPLKYDIRLFEPNIRKSLPKWRWGGGLKIRDFVLRNIEMASKHCNKVIRKKMREILIYFHFWKFSWGIEGNSKIFGIDNTNMWYFPLNEGNDFDLFEHCKRWEENPISKFFYKNNFKPLCWVLKRLFRFSKN